MSINRRSFVRNIAYTAAISASIPSIVNAAIGEPKKKKPLGKITFSNNNTILFQGDSITDAGRDRSITGPNAHHAFGNGYAFLLAAKLLNDMPAHNFNIYNRGISGNKVYQLSDRWQLDCLSLKPNIISVLVGVNDYWHTLTNNYNGTVLTYENDLRGLLRNTKNLLPQIQFVIGEPFAMLGCSAVNENWFPEFDKYRAAARKIALEMDAIFVPYHDVFLKATKYAPASYWTHDGVHPSMAGCQLMAEAWMQVVL